jgi:hypothetical protein
VLPCTCSVFRFLGGGIFSLVLVSGSVGCVRVFCIKFTLLCDPPSC